MRSLLFLGASPLCLSHSFASFGVAPKQLAKMLSPRNLAVVALLGSSVAQDTYDYVIVGGGVTGLVVANRLTEDKKSKTTQPSQMYAS
jgi:hypothetical protein